MADIVKINGVAKANIVEINDILATNIEFVNNQDFVADSVSLSQYSITINGGMTDSVTVTSSGAWTAAKTLDNDNIISSFTGSGGDGDSLSVTMNVKSPGTYDTARITVTVGSANAVLEVDINA